MKNKGFTLVELLGVVTILAMLGLIIVPTVSGILSDNKKKLYDVQVRMIEDGASNFVSEHIFQIEIPLNSSVGITLGNLKTLGYIDNDITNPITRKKFSDNLLVVITNTSKGYTYSICEDCTLSIPQYGANCAEIFC